MGGWSGITHNIGILYHNITVFQIFIWGYQSTVSIKPSANTHSISTTNTPNILYIKLVLSCVITNQTNWRCCIYLIRNTECCVLLSYIICKYFSCFNIISGPKFCGIQSICHILDFYIQRPRDTADIISGRTSIGYSVIVLNIYCTLISCFYSSDNIAVNGYSICCLKSDSHIYFTYIVWFTFILGCVCEEDTILGFIHYNLSCGSEDIVFKNFHLHSLSHSNIFYWIQ